MDKVWKMKKTLKKENEEKSSVINRKGVEVFSDEAIIKEYEHEFGQRLAHGKIDSCFAKYEESSNRLLKLLIDKALQVNEPDFTFDEVYEVCQSFKAGKSPSPTDFFPPEMLKNAGIGLLNKIKDVINAIKNNNKIPKEWEEVVIKTLYKKKGSRKLLELQRYISFVCHVQTSRKVT